MYRMFDICKREKFWSTVQKPNSDCYSRLHAFDTMSKSKSVHIPAVS